MVTTVLGGLGDDRPADLHHQPARRPGLRRASLEIDLSREFGIFLGLVELIALTVGGYMTMQEEGVSFGGAADRLSGPGSAGQQPQPPAAAPAGPAAATAAAAAASSRRSQPPPPPRSLRRRRRQPPTGPRTAYAGVASAIPAATCLAKAMIVIIGLTPTALGKSEASAT